MKELFVLKDTYPEVSWIEKAEEQLKQEGIKYKVSMFNNLEIFYLIYKVFL
jgi:pyruvate/2-oxoglutarate dehydrogenase complex dihydrolipoamide dehydrogenase (E3) component